MLEGEQFLKLKIYLTLFKAKRDKRKEAVYANEKREVQSGQRPIEDEHLPSTNKAASE